MTRTGLRLPSANSWRAGQGPSRRTTATLAGRRRVSRVGRGRRAPRHRLDASPSARCRSGQPCHCTSVMRLSALLARCCRFCDPIQTSVARLSALCLSAGRGGRRRQQRRRLQPTCGLSWQGAGRCGLHGGLHPSHASAHASAHACMSPHTCFPPPARCRLLGACNLRRPRLVPCARAESRGRGKGDGEARGRGKGRGKGDGVSGSSDRPPRAEAPAASRREAAPAPSEAPAANGVSTSAPEAAEPAGARQCPPTRSSPAAARSLDVVPSPSACPAAALWPLRLIVGTPVAEARRSSCPLALAAEPAPAPSKSFTATKPPAIAWGKQKDWAQSFAPPPPPPPAPPPAPAPPPPAEEPVATEAEAVPEGAAATVGDGSKGGRERVARGGRGAGRDGAVGGGEGRGERRNRAGRDRDAETFGAEMAASSRNPRGARTRGRGEFTAPSPTAPEGAVSPPPGLMGSADLASNDLDLPLNSDFKDPAILSVVHQVRHRRAPASPSSTPRPPITSPLSPPPASPSPPLQPPPPLPSSPSSPAAAFNP